VVHQPAPPTPTITISGATAPAQAAGTIRGVATILLTCQGSIALGPDSPTACRANTAAGLRSAVLFTEHNLASGIPYVAGQIVQVTVLISAS
jgi:hypothetical protein